MPRDDQYALITKQGSDIHRQYPTDSITNTMDSINAFFGDMPSLSENEISTAGYFLKQAALLYGVSVGNGEFTPLKEFEKRASNVVQIFEKQASPVREFASYALGDRYPIDNASLVKKASAYFDEHCLRFGESDRRLFAKNVQKQATALGVEVGEKIQKYASNSFSHDLDYHLRNRARMAGPEGREAYEKLETLAKQASVEDCIVVLRKLDEKYNLTPFYNCSIPDPSTAVLEKSAVNLGSGMSWDIDGVTYTEQDVKKALSHPDIIATYGSSLVSMLREPTQFDELPINDKKMILQYASF